MIYVILQISKNDLMSRVKKTIEKYPINRRHEYENFYLPNCESVKNW